MNRKKRKVIFINFSGIGNGICILPVLKRFEEVAQNYSYFHNYIPVFEVSEFMDGLGLKNFLGTIPSIWRRFNKEDWDAIKKFIYENQIDLIINLRVEGPLRDLGYFAFKEEMSDSPLEFWDLHTDFQRNITAKQHNTLELVTFLAERGLDLFDFNCYWLRDNMVSMGWNKPQDQQIGFFTGASQEVKTWSASRWIELGHLILNKTNYDIAVYSGQRKKEIELARRVVNELQHANGRCELVTGLTIGELSVHLSRLALLISNDTASVHIAAALNLPTIGLYFSTDARIWGGLSERFTAVQSQSGLNCPDFKHDTGNCICYYGSCSRPYKDEVTAQRVFGAVEKFLDLANRSIPRSL